MNPVINNIINKDPKILGAVYNQLPPFSLAATTWASYNSREYTLNNDDHLNTTYGLLRMNPAMIGMGVTDSARWDVMSSVKGRKLSAREKSMDMAKMEQELKIIFG